jgi:hypothetical protein
MEQAGAHLQERISSIRHPDTGEFPTVFVTATGLDDIKAHVEGSPELIAIVQERLGSTESDAVGPSMESKVPQVFLSYAFEDSDMAGRIANALQAKGIDTFWAGWSMGAGDSLVQKINEGLEGCTHFVVLLTPVSLGKPWVRQEMDAALIRRIADKCVFIALRHGVPASDLAPLMAPYLSPGLTDFDKDIAQLVSDIHGVSRKPSLGAAPDVVVARPPRSGYSAAAMAVARVFSDGSEHGTWADPQVQVEELPSLAALTEDDAEDALHELSAFIEIHHGMFIFPKAEFFPEFDRHFREWDPVVDALRLASDMVNDRSFPTEPREIGDRQGWEPRRLNPAIAYLTSRNLVTSYGGIGCGPYSVYMVESSGATRRFVKSRA